MRQAGRRVSPAGVVEEDVNKATEQEILSIIYDMRALKADIRRLERDLADKRNEIAELGARRRQLILKS